MTCLSELCVTAADVMYTEPSHTDDQQASTGHTTRTADSHQRSWRRGHTSSAYLRQSVPTSEWQRADSV